MNENQFTLRNLFLMTTCLSGVLAVAAPILTSGANGSAWFVLYLLLGVSIGVAVDGLRGALNGFIACLILWFALIVAILLYPGP